MNAIVSLSREEALKARYNQPRVSLEELRQQEERHRQASEEFFKDAKSGGMPHVHESGGPNEGFLHR